ncbi:hypothetical protein EVG20_g7049 [Dentipellis fragilis]|uniref:Uncharacterized protein n=1 Tax=Dentipellis fragilis TaxID=205917 RepID=A0A4Y9YHJ1_9AGAM|nr:hypothetical protein EVG20_g7049 [Dentipellis fragilis]
MTVNYLSILAPCLCGRTVSHAFDTIGYWSGRRWPIELRDVDCGSLFRAYSEFIVTLVLLDATLVLAVLRLAPPSLFTIVQYTYTFHSN